MKTLKEIKDNLDNVDIKVLANKLDEYRVDTRSSVQNYIKKCESKIQKYNDEITRLTKLQEYENKYYSEGNKFIAGIDEVGRGPLAGPVVTSAVILPKNTYIFDINDSKKLSEKKREKIYDEIKKVAIDISIGIIDVDTIDNINILQATYKAMQQAISKLNVTPDIILVDAVTIPEITINQVGIIKGDAKSISIAAASIIAKVTRDKMMDEYHKLYPEYSFDKNKGYGTAEHIEAIKKYGLCPIHRRSFVKNFIS